MMNHSLHTAYSYWPGATFHVVVMVCSVLYIYGYIRVCHRAHRTVELWLRTSPSLLNSENSRKDPGLLDEFFFGAKALFR